MGHVVKINGEPFFDDENFDELLSKLRRLNASFESNKKSVNRLIGLIVKIQTNGSFSAQDWYEASDDMQLLKGLEDCVNNVNDLFLKRIEDLLKFRID